MPVPPVPQFPDDLGRRAFAFHPAILNCPANEWRFRRATWTEVLVQNTSTREEVCVPRRYLGEVSALEEPVMRVGLLKQLEYRDGVVLPAAREVIAMPRVEGEEELRTAPERSGPAPVLNIRVETNPGGRAVRMALGGIAIGIAGCVLTMSFWHGGILNLLSIHAPVHRLPFGPADNYQTVIRRLGAPAEDRWDRRPGEPQVRLLGYPRLGFTIVLQGAPEPRFVGAIDRSGNSFSGGL